MLESKIRILPQFEITPPQPGVNFGKRLDAQMTKLSQAGFPGGSVIEITCRPPKDTQNYSPSKKIQTLFKVSEAITALGFIPYPHLAARMLDPESIRNGIEEFTKLGVNRLFLIAGDSKTPYSDGLTDSLALANRVLEIHPEVEELGFAAYPGLRHPFLPPDILANSMQAKTRLKDTYPDLGIAFQAQFTFSAADINTLAADTSKLGDFPLRVGVLGPTNIAGLIKTIEYAGYSFWDLMKQKPELVAAVALNTLNQTFPITKSLHLPVGWNYRPDGLVKELNGLPDRNSAIEGVYIYTMNNFQGSADLYQSLTN